MNCRSCGTEIANNALICYRCGTALPGTPGSAPATRRGPPEPRLVPLGAALAAAAAAAARMFQLAGYVGSCKPCPTRAWN
ncbi:MAG: hypothetical protein R2712_25020 [Vicinamibacterales bacterium]